jgi:hypothetical protein
MKSEELRVRNLMVCPTAVAAVCPAPLLCALQLFCVPA